MGLVFPFKWTLVLCLAVISPISHSEPGFNDDLSVLEDETGIIDISSNGRSDVKTNLNLSPWELFVLNDLIFKLTTKQCPKMDKELLSSFKDLLSDSFKQAPMVEIQNESFLPSYSHLVRCLDFVEEKPDKAKPTEPEAEDKSEEADWTAKDALITTTTSTTEASPNKQEEDELASTWLWGFRSIHQWLSHFFSKGQTEKGLTSENEVELEKEIVHQRQTEKKREQERRIEIAYRRARQNFANFFHEMSKIVRKTCPLIHRPDKLFMRYALMDMATWATLEHRATISTAAQYFRKHEFLKLLKDCFTSL